MHVGTDTMIHELWDPAVTLPEPGQVPELDRVTHTLAHRAIEGEYQFLHESAIVFHDGEMVVAWANDPRDENSPEGVVRARRSRDNGRTWSAPEIIGPGRDTPEGRECDNHVVLHSHGERLYAYAARWRGGPSADHGWDLSSVRAVQFRYDPAAGRWEETGVSIPRFLPLQGPQQLSDGSWLIAGEFEGLTPAVAICPEDDLSAWQTYPIATVRQLLWPETTVLVEPDRLTAVIRNNPRNGPPLEYGLASESFDNGRSWSEAQPANLPMANSMASGGILSTGQRYLVWNYPDRTSRRGNLVVAVSRPGESRLSMVRTVRQGVPPVHYAGLCKSPQWSYPSTVEHDGALYVSYSISKEDCGVSEIPLTSLAVPAGAQPS